MKNEKVKEIIDKINRCRRVGSYPPLPEDESKLIRQSFIDCIKLPMDGATIKIFNEADTLIGNGYTRIVVGDYGAYFEFDENQINKSDITQKWAGKPKRKVKYIWMETNDSKCTKIYWQQDTVDYADYKVGMYYLDVLDAFAE